MSVREAVSNLKARWERVLPPQSRLNAVDRSLLQAEKADYPGNVVLSLIYRLEAGSLGETLFCRNPKSEAEMRGRDIGETAGMLAGGGGAIALTTAVGASLAGIPGAITGFCIGLFEEYEAGNGRALGTAVGHAIGYNVAKQ